MKTIFASIFLALSILPSHLSAQSSTYTSPTSLPLAAPTIYLSLQLAAGR